MYILTQKKRLFFLGFQNLNSLCRFILNLGLKPTTLLHMYSSNKWKKTQVNDVVFSKYGLYPIIDGSRKRQPIQ